MPPANANLRNSVTFPPFYDLPHDQGLDDAYFALGEDSVSRPRRHWCLLAQIESIQPWPIRLCVNVRDGAGHEFPINFHTDDRGRLIAPEAVPGHTMAVLYAEYHDFMAGPPGIRVESLKSVKVIPCSLEAIQKANDMVYKQGFDDSNICAQCGANKAEKALLRCSRCKIVHYCGQECQVKAWNTHKAECKAVKELEWFHGKDWGKHRGQYFSFGSPGMPGMPDFESLMHDFRV